MTRESKMESRYQRRTIDLNENHWAILDALAEELDARPEGGTYRSQPSWRALIRLIAEGHYQLTPSIAARMEALQSSEHAKWRLRWRKREAGEHSHNTDTVSEP